MLLKSKTGINKGTYSKHGEGFFALAVQQGYKMALKTTSKIIL